MDGLCVPNEWPCAVIYPFGSLLSSLESRPLQKATRRSASADVYMHDDSEEDDDEIGCADPVYDDLYARKVGLKVSQPISTVHCDKFLQKFWTPEEDMHVQKIRLGSQQRPWYRKIQGFRSVWHWWKTTTDIKFIDITRLKVAHFIVGIFKKLIAFNSYIHLQIFYRLLLQSLHVIIIHSYSFICLVYTGLLFPG